MEKKYKFNTYPENEDRRILAVRSYRMLDGDHEPAYDHVTSLAAQIFDVPIAIITLVETDIVYVVSGTGMEGISQEARETSICSLTILSEQVTIFEDTSLQPCLLTNPWVAGEFGLKFYAGAPLTTPDGLRIGTICLLDLKRRSFVQKDKSILQNLAVLVMDIAELSKTKKRLLIPGNDVRNTIVI